jgi:hypothetical protein
MCHSLQVHLRKQRPEEADSESLDYLTLANLSKTSRQPWKLTESRGDHFFAPHLTHRSYREQSSQHKLISNCQTQPGRSIVGPELRMAAPELAVGEADAATNGALIDITAAIRRRAYTP